MSHRVQPMERWAQARCRAPPVADPSTTGFAARVAHARRRPAPPTSTVTNGDGRRRRARSRRRATARPERPRARRGNCLSAARPSRTTVVARIVRRTAARKARRSTPVEMASSTASLGRARGVSAGSGWRRVAVLQVPRGSRPTGDHEVAVPSTGTRLEWGSGEGTGCFSAPPGRSTTASPHASSRVGDSSGAKTENGCHQSLIASPRPGRTGSTVMQTVRRFHVLARFAIVMGRAGGAVPALPFVMLPWMVPSRAAPTRSPVRAQVGVAQPTALSRQPRRPLSRSRRSRTLASALPVVPARHQLRARDARFSELCRVLTMSRFHGFGASEPCSHSSIAVAQPVATHQQIAPAVAVIRHRRTRTGRHPRREQRCGSRSVGRDGGGASHATAPMARRAPGCGRSAAGRGRRSRPRRTLVARPIMAHTKPTSVAAAPSVGARARAPPASSPGREHGRDQRSIPAHCVLLRAHAGRRCDRHLRSIRSRTESTGEGGRARALQVRCRPAR